MALPVEKLGTTYDVGTAVIDPDRAKKYAAATNDGNPAYESGKYAPPVFGVVPTWDAVIRAAREVIPPEKPDHTFPEEARSRKIGEHTTHVDDDQTYRYSEASGDMMPIHLDDDVAKGVGLPGIIVHGLCTMAICSQAVVKTVADDDPSRLKRLAVRFSKPVFPGNDVVTTIYEVGDDNGRRVYAFEATSNGDVVIKDGRAEIE